MNSSTAMTPSAMTAAMISSFSVGRFDFLGRRNLLLGRPDHQRRSLHLDDPHARALLDHGAVDALGLPLLPVHAHQAPLVVGDLLDHGAGLADEPLGADPLCGLALVEAAGDGPQGQEEAAGEA